MEIGQQVKYWVESSDEDFAAALSLAEKGHFRHSLFFAHLAVEKMLKAHVAAATEKIPPRIHDLVRLAEIANLNLSDEQRNTLREFKAYLLEGRYPDSQQMPLDRVFLKHELTRMKEMTEWLKAKLPT